MKLLQSWQLFAFGSAFFAGLTAFSANSESRT
jgi:hypothetical protein